ncbi:ABC transporter ATP-binding protein [Shinella granuli]|jgi:NitT/TauT family transport system ATP-binding protein|uniref:NitT/TauT family transport system ATP-binding protein n=1 Tax=Shinella granuli TaxID=323621 RepID=A0A4R2CWC5_SHIGR|nr:ABC transporter ATP-binding protein [Shinella granuli]TCN43689.1 NitT/TauT family transport system ATP-binding protein [Shinella granuli]
MALALAEAPAASIALDVEGVSHRYELDGKELKVLDNVSLTIAPGEFVALLGPSGCGKSTLLRLAAGLETPTTGRVLEDGRPVTAPNPDRILVFQDATLFPWRTVRGNIATGLEARGLIREREYRIDEVLELVKLEGFADFYPHQLSGGMAQRAALARALVNDPKLLLLDEPFGKLDSLTRLRMQNELLDLWKSAGFTALLVTHDVEEALLLADRVIVLSDRPAAIVAEVRVDRPHPRRRDDASLIALRRSLLETLGIAHDV